MISTSHQLYAVYALAPNASFLLINSNFIETFHRHLFFPKKMKHFLSLLRIFFRSKKDVSVEAKKKLFEITVTDISS